MWSGRCADRPILRLGALSPLCSVTRPARQAGSRVGCCPQGEGTASGAPCSVHYCLACLFKEEGIYTYQKGSTCFPGGA